jgi:hypothetical protein
MPGGNGDYPFHCLSFVSGLTRTHAHTHRCNLTALAFIPLVVRLAIDFDVFQEDEEEEEERGGLLTISDSCYILGYLMRSDTVVTSISSSSSSSNERSTTTQNQEHHRHELVDDTYLDVMIQS